MLRFNHKRLLWTVLALFASSVLLAPAVSLAHGLSHLEENEASAIAELEGEEPVGDVDLDSHCDFCDALTTGRSAIAVAWETPTDLCEANYRTGFGGSLLLPQSALRTPESQRAPPLS